MNAIDQLILNIQKKQNPTAVGLDPVINKIPNYIKSKYLETYGNSVKAAAESILEFNKKILDAIHHLIPAVKFQMACYEIYGPLGIEVFEKSLLYAKEYGLSIIADGKRNDIGSTANLYAKAYLGKIPLIQGTKDPLPIDFLTINPYLGSDGIIPFIDQCEKTDKGIFILVRTSNPSASEFQDFNQETNPLYMQVAKQVQALSNQIRGQHKYSCVGAVVGATWPDKMKALREQMPNVFFLLPGYGAQGADASQICFAFGKDGLGAIVNSSRGIIYAWNTCEFDEIYFAAAAKKAVLEMKMEILQSLKHADKLPDNWNMGNI